MNVSLMLKKILVPERKAFSDFLKLIEGNRARRERLNEIFSLQPKAQKKLEAAFLKTCATLDLTDFQALLEAQKEVSAFGVLVGGLYGPLSNAPELPMKSPAAVNTIRLAASKAVGMLERKLLAMRDEEDTRGVRDGLQTSDARARHEDLLSTKAKLDNQLAALMSRHVDLRAPVDDRGQRPQMAGGEEQDRERELRFELNKVEQVLRTVPVIQYSESVRALEVELKKFSDLAVRAERDPDPFQVVGIALRELLSEAT